MSAPQRRAITAPASGGGGGSGASFAGGSASGSSSLASPVTRTVSLASGTSSYGRAHSRTMSALTAAEEASMAAAQELTSVANAPPSAGGGAAAWLAALPFGQAFGAEDYDAPPPPLPPGTLPEVKLSDFSRYLRSVGNRLEQFERSRAATQRRAAAALSPEELRASQGQGLVTAMREVPAAFFQEAFDLDQKQLWEEVVQVGSEDARQESLDRLSGYLDTVETHLVREIAARTDNFFDASGYIQDVRGSVTRLHQEVAALRSQMHTLEQETGAAVATSRQLQHQRGNLLETLEVLRAMEGIAQAQSALQGLLPQSGGVAVDYAGAIDVLEVLQGVLDDESLLALECFKHLPDQIVETAQAVDDLMTSDFLERCSYRCSYPCGAALAAAIHDRLRAQAAATDANTPRRRRSSSSLTPTRTLSAEESAELETLAALHLEERGALDRVSSWLERSIGCGSSGAGGAGRAAATSARLSSGYPEDGGADAAALPLGSEAEGSDGGGGSEPVLQEVLLPLVVGLQRMGRLPAAMKGLKSTQVARLKELLSHVIEGCLDILDPETAPGDSSHLLLHRSLSPGRERGGGGGGGEAAALASRLGRLPGHEFQWVLEAVVLATRAYAGHAAEMGQAVQEILGAAQASKQQLGAAAADARECCQGVADAAAARWSRLLTGRARASGEAGAAGIRLTELQGVLELTDVLASLVEQHGVRGVLGLRSVLQQLCKAALDGLHSKSLSKLTTLLEQEQWAVVEVPPQFQEIVVQLEARAAAEAGGGAGQGAAAAEGSNGASGAPRGGKAPAEVPRKYTITPPEGLAANGSGGGGGAAGATGPSAALLVAGQRYHVVNTQLLLLSTLRDYLAFRDVVPAFGAEVAQRVLELLKVFNSRTCQLVLGAGAMQVSGLKSITAKHLALSCQCLGAFMALHPSLVALFTQGLMPPRRDMLLADFGRALQDYRIHHEEICTKLVSIMRERLSANLRQLPALAAAWPAGGELEELPPPSGFAATAAKQLHILTGALGPLLLQEELHSIFGRIAIMFSNTLAEAYELLEPHGAAWDQQLRADMQFLLNVLRNLPQDPALRDTHLERLTQLFEQRFMRPQAPPPEPQRRVSVTAVPSAQPAAATAAVVKAAGPPAPPEPAGAQPVVAATAAAAAAAAAEPMAAAAEPVPSAAAAPEPLPWAAADAAGPPEPPASPYEPAEASSAAAEPASVAPAAVSEHAAAPVDEAAAALEQPPSQPSAVPADPQQPPAQQQQQRRQPEEEQAEEQQAEQQQEAQQPLAKQPAYAQEGQVEEPLHGSAQASPEGGQPQAQQPDVVGESLPSAAAAPPQLAHPLERQQRPEAQAAAAAAPGSTSSGDADGDPP
ncbi:vacuolar sorting-associated chloroplastic [Micractinium conductrix]|uniref:Vacuolar protein sorting-associated protein 54 n=1 Tax=Micractinium conductrix TaxID=554055 RepID=A0A2P6VJM2_9CHLO|nr:vacuolar sorting-associated chloroplastic [Micractinium conductrix]|eukprot:PSC74274.1 vacuolar sorting-associated chloroplastic [Micractinium conductrix]